MCVPRSSATWQCLGKALKHPLYFLVSSGVFRVSSGTESSGYDFACQICISHKFIPYKQATWKTSPGIYFIRFLQHQQQLTDDAADDLLLFLLLFNITRSLIILIIDHQ